MESLKDLMGPFERPAARLQRVRIARAQLVVAQNQSRGPGRRGVHAEHRGAQLSHRGKPKDYVKPVIAGATESAEGALEARRARTHTHNTYI